MEYASMLGIDVAATKLDCCWVGSMDGLQYASISYTADDLDTFLAANPEIDSNHTTVGLESTGEYHVGVSIYFLERGFQVKIINPIITKEYNRATIRGTKTDKVDSALIVKALREGHGDYTTISQLLDRDKELLRLSTTLTNVATKVRQRIKSTKRKQISNMDSITKRMEKVAQELTQLAGDITTEATEGQTEEEKFIDSIPGFALKLSAIVYHEIGDIQRFPNAKSLVAFAGLDPKIKQSGGKLNTTGKLTKRGSPHLRYALFLAANVARRYDDDLAAYYSKKKGEGRSHREVLCMIGRKLLARIYTVWKERRMYERKPIVQ